MDSLITAAARALASGDPFGALNRVALRDDAPGLHLAAIGRRKLYPQQSRVQVRTTCRSKTPTAEGPGSAAARTLLHRFPRNLAACISGPIGAFGHRREPQKRLRSVGDKIWCFMPRRLSVNLWPSVA
jgi:hypothetical protein